MQSASTEIIFIMDQHLHIIAMTFVVHETSLLSSSSTFLPTMIMCDTNEKTTKNVNVVRHH